MRSITEDILQWSEKFLEPKNESLGNVPVCPYARMARLKKTYAITECYKSEEFLDKIIEGIEQIKSPDKQIVIVACSEVDWEIDELNAVIHTLNVLHVPQDIYLMASHPYDEEEDEPVDFLETESWSPDNDFMMVLIQNFDELEKASDNLRKTGYYDSWPSDYYGGTVLKRQSYRRYRDGLKKSR